jgi:dienelactone hydrolase
MMMCVSLWNFGRVDSVVGGRGDAREAFLRLIERDKTPLAQETKIIDAPEGLAGERFSFAAQANERVPGLLYRTAQSKGSRRPAVIALHGTGGAKESQIALMEKLARRGFVAVAIDGRYHGERAGGAKGAAAYTQAILRAYRAQQEHPFLYDAVWDVRRLIDYLETRDDIDPKRIGMIGFSKGGMETYLTAAVDSRVAAAVPCIGVQSFGWALDHNAWQSRVGTFQAAVDAAARDENVDSIDAAFIRRFYDRVAPGVYSQFDGPAMLPLIAPRPLLVINGDSDARTPLPGLMECVDIARAAYAKAGAADRFEFLLQEKTGHAVTPGALETAIAFFEKRLAPQK